MASPSHKFLAPHLSRRALAMYPLPHVRPVVSDRRRRGSLRPSSSSYISSQLPGLCSWLLFAFPFPSPFLLHFLSQSKFFGSLFSFLLLFSLPRRFHFFSILLGQVFESCQRLPVSLLFYSSFTPYDFDYFAFISFELKVWTTSSKRLTAEKINTPTVISSLR